MSLQGESTLTNEQKVTEAEKHVNALLDHFEEMTPEEQRFVSDLSGKFEKWGKNTFISNKVLFWLRDLNMKY